MLSLDSSRYLPNDVHDPREDFGRYLTEVGKRRDVLLWNNNDMHRPKRSGVMERQHSIRLGHNLNTSSPA